MKTLSSRELIKILWGEEAFEDARQMKLAQTRLSNWTTIGLLEAIEGAGGKGRSNRFRLGEVEVARACDLLALMNLSYQNMKPVTRAIRRNRKRLLEWHIQGEDPFVRYLMWRPDEHLDSRSSVVRICRKEKLFEDTEYSTGPMPVLAIRFADIYFAPADEEMEEEVLE